MSTETQKIIRNEVLSQDQESTVISEYREDMVKSGEYQTEAMMEDELIRTLIGQGYERLSINNYDGIKNNLRKQLSKLNNYNFSDSEWLRLLNEIEKGDVQDKTKIIHDKSSILILKLDSGFDKNIYLLKKEDTDINENIVQVINQYRTQNGKGRYDVSILINGLPMVHIELKKRERDIEEAYNQIDRYHCSEGTDPLLDFTQIFIISNGLETKYYTNTTRKDKLNSDPTKSKASFENTNYWSDEKNNLIKDIEGFSKTFLTRRVLLNIITKYCVLKVDQSLVVMRPYQIVAVEKILKVLNRPDCMVNCKKGGYIWHTTGSGKTLTSFKTAILAGKIKDIDKILFVVDRKDLDYQTVSEYERFEEGASLPTKDTKSLIKHIEDDSKIVVTTIQKFDRSISKIDPEILENKRFVIIFDECHRSQFGSMHKNITSKIKNYCIFGFTGTPIFEENGEKIIKDSYQTTERAFGKQLHRYDISSAIRHKNVLKFKVSYYGKAVIKGEVKNESVQNIDTDEFISSPDRINDISKYILNSFSDYTCKKQFNAILTVSSIDQARKYYSEFKALQKDTEESKKLKIATIFSYSNSPLNDQLVDDSENPDDADGLNQSEKEFLDSSIEDYNKLFGKTFDSSSKSFNSYYKDVSRSVKDKKLDLLIVVNMFLTGFDSPRLNTLFVDRNLENHGLIQAYSRTNRKFNKVKTHGNIVCFRPVLKEKLNSALILFGQGDQDVTISILPAFDEIYSDYEKAYNDVFSKFPDLKTLDNMSIEESNEFLRLFGAFVKIHYTIKQFDEYFADDSKKKISDRDMQDFTGKYREIYRELLKKGDGGKASIEDNVIFEGEILNSYYVDNNFILKLIQSYQGNGTSKKDIISDISSKMTSQGDNKDKVDLMIKFIEYYNGDLSLLRKNLRTLKKLTGKMY